MKKLFLLLGLCSALFIGCQKAAETVDDADAPTVEVVDEAVEDADGDIEEVEEVDVETDATE